MNKSSSDLKHILQTEYGVKLEDFDPKQTRGTFIGADGNPLLTPDKLTSLPNREQLLFGKPTSYSMYELENIYQNLLTNI